MQSPHIFHSSLFLVAVPNLSPRATKFAANDEWGKIYRKLFGVTEMSQSISVLTGASAGATETFVVVPFELVKIRLQDKKSSYNGPIDVVKKVVASDGLFGLYTGLESTMWRHVLWNAGYFGVIFQVKKLLPKSETKQGQMANDLIAGSIGGTFGTILNTPYHLPPQTPMLGLSIWKDTNPGE